MTSWDVKMLCWAAAVLSSFISEQEQRCVRGLNVTLRCPVKFRAVFIMDASNSFVFCPNQITFLLSQWQNSADLSSCCITAVLRR